MKYLFDLDETLIHSDSLNCDAYNYALEKCGYPRIEDCLRLTRDSLQFIPTTDLKKIIKIKQNYFTKSWLPYRIVLNTALLQRIKTILLFLTMILPCLRTIISKSWNALFRKNFTSMFIRSICGKYTGVRARRVLVYKLDRFSRNKYEMAIHRKHLKDNGIKILSAMENIPCLLYTSDAADE